MVGLLEDWFESLWSLSPAGSSSGTHDDMGKKAVIVVLFCLTFVLPYVYMRLFHVAPRPSKLFVSDPVVLRAVRRQYPKLDAVRVRMIEQLCQVAKNLASSYAPYKIKEIYAGGAFFNLEITNDTLKNQLVLVCVAEGKKDPEPTMAAKFLKDSVFHDIRDASRRFRTPDEAIPYMVEQAVEKGEANAPAVPTADLIVIYRDWLKGMQWKHCRNPSRMASLPWDPYRILSRVLRRGTYSIDVGPVTTKNPNASRVIDSSVKLHLVWKPGDNTPEALLPRITEAFEEESPDALDHLVLQGGDEQQGQPLDAEFEEEQILLQVSFAKSESQQRLSASGERETKKTQ